MNEFINEYGYLALMLVSFIEGEMGVLLAACLIYDGPFSFMLTALFGFIAVFLSDWMYYFIGKAKGKNFIDKRPRLQRLVMPINKFYENYRPQLLISYRFLYGFRIITLLVIGMSGMRPIQFLPYAITSGLIWSVLVTSLGYFAGRYFHLTSEDLSHHIILIIAGFAAFGLTLSYVIERVTLRRIKPPAESNDSTDRNLPS